MQNKWPHTANPFEGLGEAIRLLRKQRGLTLAELAGKAGLGRGQLSRIENGQQLPTLTTVGDVLAALDCGLPELYRALQLVRRQQRVLPRPKMAAPLPN